MKKNQEFKSYVGIDISKSKLDAALLISIKESKFLNYSFSNNLVGFNKFYKWLKKNKIVIEQTLICMETTGHYGWVFMDWLYSINAKFVEESALRIKKSLGIARGHEDKLDARRISKYCYEKSESLKLTEKKDDNIRKMKIYLSHRQQLIKQSVMIQNNIHVSLEVKKVIDNSIIIKQLRNHLKFIKKQVDQIDEKIDEIIKISEELKKNYELTKSVVGIGKVNVWYFIAYTNNFKDFDDGRKYAAFIGVAPYPFQSGTIDKGSRVSFFAHKTLKTVLSNAAISAVNHDSQIRAYFQRKLKEGKEEGKIYNAIKFKLILRIFAVVKRQQPYVKINY